jgi:hypothetical protein
MGGSDGQLGSSSQLVQAMAGFDGGAAESSNTTPLGADPSQQQFLTTPQHASGRISINRERLRPIVGEALVG